jgi:hypothetical protein
MDTNNRELWERIGRLTALDLEWAAAVEAPENARWALYASLLQEQGEFATAVQVERGIIRHKELDEPAYSEAIDVFICAAMMFFVCDGKVEEVNMDAAGPEIDARVREVREQKDGVLRLVGIMSSRIGLLAAHMEIHMMSPATRDAALWVAENSVSLYAMLGGEYADLAMLANKKLDKWEKTQAKRNQ